MFKNYLKIAFRNIIRHKVYSFINITGLAIGLACFILIFLWIQDEVNFDRFYTNTDNIYRIYSQYPETNNTWETSYTPYPLATILKDKYPEVEKSCRILTENVVASTESTIFREDKYCFVDPAFLEIFEVPFIEGNPENALSAPYSVIITKDMAHKYFGNDVALGKTLKINDFHEFTVSAIMENPPKNTQFQFNFISPYSFLEASGQPMDGWIGGLVETYVQVAAGTNIVSLASKIKDLGEEHSQGCGYILKLQPLKNMHLYSLTGSPEQLKFVQIFSVIAVFILLIACINFMNLSTARSTQRTKEVGIRKVLGADRLNLIKQFFGESIVMTFFALFIAIALVELTLPHFNNFTGKDLVVDLLNFKTLIGLIAVSAITGILSGIYPAMFLSSFKPAKIIKGSINWGSGNLSIRKILVVTQFALSIALIICTGIIYAQLNYIQNKDLGYQKDNLVYFQMDGLAPDKYPILKEQMLQNLNVLSMTRTSERPSFMGIGASDLDWDGKGTDEVVGFTCNAVDYDYIETLGIDVIEGRDYSEEFSSDFRNYILNEEAVKQMGITNPIGQRFSLWGFEGKIIGIIKNFNSKTLNHKIEPMFLTVVPNWYKYIFVRVGSENLSTSLAHIETVWSQVAPGTPFEYHFLDEDFSALYKTEQQMGSLFKVFAVLAIFISSLGLFGLVAFSAEKRTKEIGIRKVLGASVANIVWMLSQEFTKWVLIANLIAWPVAYFAMNKWLESFAYKVNLSLWIFLTSGFIALIIALATVSFQSIKAATSNPINALKYE